MFPPFDFGLLVLRRVCNLWPLPSKKGVGNHLDNTATLLKLECRYQGGNGSFEARGPWAGVLKVITIRSIEVCRGHPRLIEGGGQVFVEQCVSTLMFRMGPGGLAQAGTGIAKVATDLVAGFPCLCRDGVRSYPKDVVAIQTEIYTFVTDFSFDCLGQAIV